MHFPCMQPDTALAWVLTFAALFVALWQVLRGQVFVTIVDGAARGETTMPDDDEEQPETDRAPASPRKWPAVAYALAGTATVRLALRVALHR